jgi:CubicO group peptidase (beta-lactamase class C family)
MICRWRRRTQHQRRQQRGTRENAKDRMHRCLRNPRYSGEGFRYLQAVVVEVTGKSFERFMLDDILD